MPAKDWCVECGHGCHCKRVECFFWNFGQFKYNPAWEICHHGTCVHGKPHDPVECVLCKKTMSYKESTTHDCRAPEAVKA